MTFPGLFCDIDEDLKSSVKVIDVILLFLLKVTIKTMIGTYLNLQSASKRPCYI